MAATNQFVQGYPTQFGNKIAASFDRAGSSSYTQYNASTGAGDIFNASDVGLGGFDKVGATFSGYTLSGTYIVQVKLTKANDCGPGAAAKRVTLQWFTTSAAFGAISTEVSGATDLSAETIRLDYIGI